MNYIFAIDSGSDLSVSYAQNNHLHVFPLTCRFNNQEMIDDLGASYSHKDFYNTIREGALPTTSQVNVFTFKQQFALWAKEGLPVLYIALSSGLSGTYNSAMIAREQVLEDYPKAKIAIIDSLCASGGVGLLIHMTLQLLKQGHTFEQAVIYAENLKHHIVHVFTVDDLHHLERGGRVSYASAFVGTLLQIKPVLYINDEGKLIPYQKCRGRKKALHALCEHLGHMISDKNAPVIITHSDALDEAHALAHTLESQYGISEIMLYNIGVVIGSHTGPGTIALFFLGEHKSPSI